MPRTKKAGITGRFGPRYGSTLRKRVKKIEENMKKKQKCPSCESMAVYRVSVGIWECKKCSFKFTGGAWLPVTSEGKKATRNVKRLKTMT